MTYSAFSATGAAGASAAAGAAAFARVGAVSAIEVDSLDGQLARTTLVRLSRAAAGSARWKRLNPYRRGGGCGFEYRRTPVC
jgi:hypothetical protein